ncbi:BTB/POZ domain-containing protein 2-like isoform X1 [Ostrea edulis]|uniref:BTB/POZ domain-containing protein 2-like isoform X1 n=1 Tax=Ostrea edulis TaxID=37623 RepID=UPI0024AFFF14|nr:BTB/POZ domain-containing protein 2-like isoform X1 [Ostrea edulis]
MSLAENSNNWRSGLSLAECNRYMLTHQIHCDVTFRVGKEGKLVRAHKYVLSSRSPVFDAMLYGDLAESDDIIVPDIEPSSFDALLRFLYCDDDSFTPDRVTSVLYAADKYGVDDLVTKIKSHLDQNITNETVLTVLESAKSFNLEDLLKKCKNFIESDPFAVLQSSSALEMTKETLTYIISLDSLVMDELEIYRFLIKWAENQCDRVGIETIDQNIRAMMGDLIYLIRFPLMNLDIFVKDVCNREILNVQEQIPLQQVIVGNLDKKNTKLQFVERKSKTFCVLRGDCRMIDSWSCDGLADCIEFTVNKTVRIHGFVMWGGLSIPYAYTIQGKLFANSEEVSTVPVQTIEKRKSSDIKFTIPLPEPVRLAPSVRYRAWVRLEGPTSWRGHSYRSSVTDHGVKFNFYTHIGENNATSSDGGQFPGFVCSL